MKYVQCCRCQARFHAGVIYEPIEECPRCGAAVHARASRLHARVRALLRRPDELDWEAITGSQYTPRVRRSQTG